MPVRRRVVGAGVILLGLMAASLALAGPVLAANEEGSDPAPGIGLLPALGIFVGVPLLVYVIVAGLVYAPARMGRERYRPGAYDWPYAPVWIGGPEDAKTVLTRTPTDVVLDVRGGGAGAGW